MKIECVVFDIDDTLYLERDYARSGFYSLDAYARDELGIDSFAARAWTTFEAGARGTIFDDVLRDAGVVVDEAIIAELVRRYREHTPDVSLPDDARSTLERLAPRCALGAITDGPSPSQRAKIGALGLSRWIETIVVTDELGREFWKPHPRAFELVREAARCAHASCVYVADNPRKDFIAPRSLGWTTVRIRRAGGLHRAAPSGDDVAHEIRSLDELPNLCDL